MSNALAGSTFAGDNYTILTPIDDRWASMVFGIFMGVMITASAYLFFIWIVMRDRGQVFLLFLLLCLAANIASTNDQLVTALGLHQASSRALLASYSMIFSSIFSVFFTYYFLDVGVNCANFRLPLFLLGGILFIFLIYSIVDQSTVRFILPALGTLTITVVLATGLASLRAGVSGSFTHIIAFIFFLAGTLAEPFYDLGFIRDTASSTHLAYIAFSMAALMFAIVIASQFAARQEEKEKALAVSNERFSLATRGANEGLFDWNLLTGEVFFSDQFRKILNTRLENNAQGLKIWSRLISPADRQVVRKALRRFQRNPGINTINLEYRINTASDQKQWLHTKAVAVRDARSKKIIRLVGSTSDITARKQSDVALRASETRFRSITEAHPVPVLIVGLRSGKILYASPGAEDLLKIAQNQIVYEYFDHFLTDTTAHKEIWDVINQKQDINLKEIHLRLGNGDDLDAALSARPISYQNEDAMVLGLYDLTERKHAEAQIARQQDALQQSEKMAALGGLLAGVAHELNNPLSVVVGQATLLMEGSTEPKTVARADKIFKAADRCARIVKSFLALARRKPPEHKKVNLNEVVSASLELLGYQIRNADVEINLKLDPALPAIIGDGDQLTQVVTNLVLNAAQAMDGCAAPRRITLESGIDATGQVNLKVMDTGPGVPADIKSKIFEPFFTTKAPKGGTGVGLALCLNIVASHGGQITVEPTPGGGASFIITLPVMAQAADDAPEATNKALPALADKLRILLVDDEVEIAQTLADLLEPEGHTVDLAANGAIAFAKLQKNTFDVIISDLRMPVMDGPTLYKTLAQALPVYLNRIIYVTGDTLSAHVQSFLSEHPVLVVEKPYRLVDIHHAIEEILKKAQHPH